MLPRQSGGLMKWNAPDVYQHWTESLRGPFCATDKKLRGLAPEIIPPLLTSLFDTIKQMKEAESELNKLQTEPVRGGPESPTRQQCHRASAQHRLRDFTKWMSKMSCFHSAKDIILAKDRGASTVNKHTILSQRTSLIQNSETLNCVFGDASNRDFPYQAHINYGMWTLLVLAVRLQSFQNRTVI